MVNPLANSTLKGILEKPGNHTSRYGKIILSFLRYTCTQENTRLHSFCIPSDQKGWILTIAFNLRISLTVKSTEGLEKVWQAYTGPDHWNIQTIIKFSIAANKKNKKPLMLMSQFFMIYPSHEISAIAYVTLLSETALF